MRVWPRKLAFVQIAFALLIGGTAALLPWSFSAGIPGSIAVGFMVAVLYYYLVMRRYVRRLSLMRKPFPARWQGLLERCVPFYRKLSPKARERFENDIRFFIAEQRIYALKGKPVRNEIKVLVAAGAAMLGHGLPDWEWPQMRDIIIYPTAFDENYRPGNFKDILGQVHMQGPILLSAKDVIHGFCVARRGVNVGLHELAHVMDMADGQADGVPVGLEWVATAPWVEIISDRMRKVQEEKVSGVLRPYAGVDEAEFFAVAVEAFYQKPSELRLRDPELYEILADYFNIDPETAVVRRSKGME